jgi:hypothetical protein
MMIRQFFKIYFNAHHHVVIKEKMSLLFFSFFNMTLVMRNPEEISH